MWYNVRILHKIHHKGLVVFLYILMQKCYILFKFRQKTLMSSDAICVTAETIQIH